MKVSVRLNSGNLPFTEQQEKTFLLSLLYCSFAVSGYLVSVSIYVEEDKLFSIHLASSAPLFRGNAYITSLSYFIHIAKQ